MFLNLRQRFRKESFLRSVAVLMSGTAAAQAILVLVLPLLTRIYSPEDFSVLAVYVSALSVLSISACLRLEIAIPLPVEDVQAASLLVLALACAFAVTALIAMTILVFPETATGLAGQGALGPYLWLLPIGVWLSSSYSALQYWSTRKRRFGDIARTRLGQAIGGASTQLGLGVLGHAPVGLLVGQMVVSGSGVFGLATQAIRRDWRAISAVRFQNIRKALREYQRFPKYSTFDALANTAGLQTPILIIASFAVGPEAGLLMLAMRTMQAPMALMGSSVGQVFLSEAPEKQRCGELADFASEIMAGLARVGAGPLVFAGIVSPVVFTYVFGEAWSDAGRMVPWMVPWFILQFISSPVSMVMHVLQRQAEMLVLTMFGLLARVGLVVAAALGEPGLLVEAFAVGSTAFYAVLTVVILRRSGCGSAHVRTILRSGLQSVLPGTLAGLLLLVAYSLWSA